MVPDTFSEQRMPARPLELDLTRTAVIVVDMVNEIFEPGGKMVLAGGTVLYAPVNALLDAAHQAHLPVLYTNQFWRNRLFLQAFSERRGQCSIFGKRLLISNT